jgi:hypothetical protein
LQSKEPAQEAVPQSKWQMSDGPIDRSNALDKPLHAQSNKNITDGEMTSFSKLVLQSKEPGQEAMPECKWQISDGPIDRSNPSDKPVHSRTKKYYRW